jgi:hypothetical protein
MRHGPDHQPRSHSDGHQPPPEQRAARAPGLLSQSDPDPTRPTRRPPIWLIVVVLVIAAVILMHIAGAGSH